MIVAPAAITTGGCETYRPLLQQYGWDASIALAVMQAESGCDPNSDNTGLNYDGSNDKGLMQVNSIHVKSGLIGDAERFNPAANVKAAFAIYLGSGWSAWSSFNSNKYLKFL